jgi:D-alanyl-D-alanine carboxypeptidase (penicillin-binding protein 5/6)
MNRKALQLGLKNTRFQNSTGLDQGGQYSTPRDLAVISRELVTKYPEVYAYSSLKSAVVQHEDGSHLYLKNTNDMLGFEGINGLKTGSSANGGYHLAMTYQKDGKHLLFVIMGEDLPYFRKEDSKKLLDQFT